MSAWTTAQARRFLASARDGHDPLYLGYVLLLCLGLRRGELLGLHWDDIDPDSATVHIQRELQRFDGRLILSDTKTLDSATCVPPLGNQLQSLPTSSSNSSSGTICVTTHHRRGAY